MAQTIWDSFPFPKVGIRPIIDGRRRGVRESLEVQTMKMAQTAADLISSSLSYLRKLHLQYKQIVFLL